MKAIKLALCILVLTLLAACSNGPSTSEAKQSISSMIGECEYLSLSNFKKVNGAAEGSNGYQVAISYTVTSKPVPHAEAIINALNRQLVDVNARVTDAQSQLDTDTANLRNAINARVNNTGDLGDKKWNSMNAANEIITRKSWMIDQARIPLRAEFAKLCPNTDMQFYDLFFSSKDISQYATTLAQDFSHSIQMIKTDNGWQAN